MTETNKWPPRVWFTHLSEKEIFAGKTAIAWPDSKNCTREYLSLSEHLALLNEEKKRGERMREALKGIMARIDDGTICRDISKDHLPTWSLRMIELVQNLADARAALENETKGEA